MGESTPLLSQNSSQNNSDEENALSQSLEPTAPPPATAPPLPPPPQSAPPPPPSSKPSEQQPPLKTVEDSKSSSASSYQKGDTKTSKESTVTGEDQSQAPSKTSKKKKKKDGKAGKKGESGAAVSAAQKKKKVFDGPRKSWFHLVFDFVRYTAMLASTMMLVIQIIPFIVLGVDGTTGLQIAVRIYLMLFCICFILVESRISFLMRLFPQSGLGSWILRGFLYTFIGIIGMEQELASKVEDIAAGVTSSILGPDYGTLFASLFMSITTWIMIGVGGLYVILGILCMQHWYNKMESDYNKKLEEWKQKKKRDKKAEEEQKRNKKQERKGEWYDDIES